MTIASKVYEIIFKSLKENPDGLRWSELLREIKKQDPTIHPKTANGLVWKLVEKYPDKFYKTEEGRFRLL